MKVEVIGVFEVDDAYWELGSNEGDYWFYFDTMPNAKLILQGEEDTIGVLEPYKFRYILMKDNDK